MFNFIKENPILCLVAFLLVVSPSFLFGAVQIIAVIVMAIIILAVVGLLSLKWRVSKLQKQARQSYEQRGYGAEEQKVNMGQSSHNKKVADDVGDYVEFEEIKDK